LIQNFKIFFSEDINWRRFRGYLWESY